MKKFLKYCLYALCFSMVLFTGIFSCSSINKANAVDSDNTHVVNFYGADNQTVIYSTIVQDGQSLLDVANSNIFDNSDFYNKTLKTVPPADLGVQKYYPDGYNLSDQFYNNIDNEVTGVLLQTDYATRWYSFFYKNILSTNYRGKTITLTAKIGDITGITSSDYNIMRVILSGGNLAQPDYNNPVYNVNTPIVANSVISVTAEIPNTLAYLRFDFFRRITDLFTIDIDWIKLEFSDSFTGYFSENYVNELFVESGGVIGSDFEWSESVTSSSRFDFSKPITSDINLYGYNFNGQIYNYDGEVSSDYGNLGNYAISDIEFFEVSGTYLYHLVIDSDLYVSSSWFLKLPYISSLSSETIADSFYCNTSNSSAFFNMFVYSEMPAVSGSGGGYLGALSLSYDSSGFYLRVLPNYGKVHFYFSLLQFKPTSRTTFELIPNSDYIYLHRFYDDLTSIVDMQSSTNYSFSLAPSEFNFSNTSMNKGFLDYILNNFDSSSIFPKTFTSQVSNNFNIFYSLNNSDFTNFINFNYVYDSDLFSARIELTPAVIVNTDFVNFNVVDCFFFVHRPVQRVDNTLVIYNFDYYNILYSVNGISYQLQADGDLYNVNYSGSVPNDYFIYISNDDVINTIFDEYVHVYLTFDNNNIILKKVDDSTYSCDFGFDFNFTYYVQPLVTNNGVYNYDFEKPGYVEMSFSLNPLHIPLLEMIENAFIFLVFYCPLISDILTFLRFDYFFGGLINIVNFITNSEIGDFILSCFAFLILWLLLKSIFPSFVSSGREASQNFVNSMVDASDLIDSKSVKRYKGYKFKSWLGSNNFEQIKANHLKRFNYVGYRGRKNNPYKKTYIRISKMKKRR